VKVRKVLYWLNGLGFLATFIILVSLTMTNTIRPWVFSFIIVNLALYFDHVSDLKRRLALYEKDPITFLFTVKESGTYKVTASFPTKVEKDAR
jgi:hypothetical protein